MIVACRFCERERLGLTGNIEFACANIRAFYQERATEHDAGCARLRKQIGDLQEEGIAVAEQVSRELDERQQGVGLVQ